MNNVEMWERGCVGVELSAKWMRDVPISVREVIRPSGRGYDVGGRCLFRVMYSS